MTWDDPSNQPGQADSHLEESSGQPRGRAGGTLSAERLMVGVLQTRPQGRQWLPPMPKSVVRTRPELWIGGLEDKFWM